MSYYGGTVTVAGINLITSLIAGETIQFTKIMVGTGSVPEGKTVMDMTDLAEPKCAASSTIPVAENGRLYMTVEYRNDMNGGLKESFWLREFGVYAKTDRQEECLLYYATLGDSPQPVSAFKENRVDIRRYPITIVLATDAKVQLLYDTNAFLTSQDAQTIITTLIHNALTGEICHAITEQITIPKEGWVSWEEAGSSGYNLYRDVTVDVSTEAGTPYLALDVSSLDAAAKCGFAPTAECHDGSVRFFTVEAPSDALTGSLQMFFPGSPDDSSVVPTLAIATRETLGVVKIGDNIQVLPDGTIYVDAVDVAEDVTANDQEADDVIDGVFGEDDDP